MDGDVEDWPRRLPYYKSSASAGGPPVQDACGRGQKSAYLLIPKQFGKWAALNHVDSGCRLGKKEGNDPACKPAYLLIPKPPNK